MKIVISGTVGVGKTTISKYIYNYLQKNNIDSNFVLEINNKSDRTFLKKYYENRSEWSFLIQTNFLLQRYKTLLIEQEKLNENKEIITIFDRHFLDDYVFSNLNTIKNDMSNFQYSCYKNISIELTKKIDIINQPDYFILLKLPFKEILKRIKLRGIKEEIDAPEEYWRDLYNQYYNNEKVKKYFLENTKKFIELNIINLSPEDVSRKILKLFLE